MRPRFAEFFCGGGMVRAALQHRWSCAMANDIDPLKCEVYAKNWGKADLIQSDIRSLPIAPLLQSVDLYWASSPCQDFSLAGRGLGLSGARGGLFMEWARVIRTAVEQRFAPRIVAFENVTGILTRNDGADLQIVLKTLIDLGYQVGALEIDAAKFLPQSRPRLFVVGVRQDLALGPLSAGAPSGPFHSAKIRNFHKKLSRSVAKHWIWWQHDAPADTGPALETLIDKRPNTDWLNPEQIDRLLMMMSDTNARRVAAARKTGRREIGMLYKRGRPDDTGVVKQRAEVRFDGIAGCLRTPAGGSSRQTVMFVKGKQTKARLLSSREVARLMGLDDAYTMPVRYNQAYKVAGDGVAVPVVAFLDDTLFQPILQLEQRRKVA